MAGQIKLNRYHNLDDKGRLALPVSVREQFPKSLVVALTFDGSLRLFTNDDHNAWVEKIFEKRGGFDENDPLHRRLENIMYRYCAQVDVDSAGRILIPQELRDLAHFKKEILVSGKGSTVDLWAAEEWDRYCNDDTFAPCEVFSLFFRH